MSKLKYEPDELLEKVYEYISECKIQKFVRNGPDGPIYEDKLLIATINGLQVYLQVGHDYIANYPDKTMLFRIKAILEAYNVPAIGVGDITTAFGIFYLKSKCGFSDNPVRDEIAKLELAEKQRANDIMEKALENNIEINKAIDQLIIERGKND